MTDERKHLPISDLKPEETALIEAVHEYDYQKAQRRAFAEAGNGR
jgi:hypothetical protein